MVRLLSEATQADQLEAYNHNKPATKKIPLVPRNEETGWPLLQVSLFAPLGHNKAGEAQYGYVIGGGDCHAFFIPAFYLVSLLTHVPGKSTLTTGEGVPISPEDFNADHSEALLSSYHFHHTNIGIKISCSESRYNGKTLNLEIPEGSSQKLASLNELLVWNAFYHALKKGRKPPLISHAVGWHDGEPYTESHLRDSINTDAAVFSNGQIHIDLGYLLKEVVQDDELTDYFGNVFKIKEFQELIQHRAVLTSPTTLSAPIEANSFSSATVISPTVVAPQTTEPPTSTKMLTNISSIEASCANKVKSAAEALITHAKLLCHRAVMDHWKYLGESPLEGSAHKRDARKKIDTLTDDALQQLLNLLPKNDKNVAASRAAMTIGIAVKTTLSQPYSHETITQLRNDTIDAAAHKNTLGQFRQKQAGPWGYLIYALTQLLRLIHVKTMTNAEQHRQALSRAAKKLIDQLIPDQPPMSSKP